MPGLLCSYAFGSASPIGGPPRIGEGRGVRAPRPRRQRRHRLWLAKPRVKEDDALVFSWERFEEVVKYQPRYPFLTLDEPDKYAEAFDVTPAKMLTRIGELTATHELIRTLPVRTMVFRGRPCAPTETYASAADLGTTPRDKAMSNRMSPAGIAVFYGALDKETTVAEIKPTLSEEKPAVSLGEFLTTSEMRLVDLASLPEIPSVFDEDNRDDRPTIRFLRQFARIVSQPAGETRAAGREIVDYIPTQVVTEYLWHVFGDQHAAGRIDGILYQSAQHNEGVCCALFVPRDNCVEAGTAPAADDAPAVELVRSERLEDARAA